MTRRIFVLTFAILFSFKFVSAEMVVKDTLFCKLLIKIAPAYQNCLQEKVIETKPAQVDVSPVTNVYTNVYTSTTSPTIDNTIANNLSSQIQSLKDQINTLAQPKVIQGPAGPVGPAGKDGITTVITQQSQSNQFPIITGFSGANASFNSSVSKDFNVTNTLTAGSAAVSGDLNAKSVSVSDPLTTRSNLGLTYATTTDIVNATNIAAWGDSLTAASYPSVLAAITGYSVYNGGVGGETSIQIAARMLAATDKRNYAAIIWAGRNNFTNPTQVKEDIATMVASLGHDRYLVLGVLNGNYAPGESAGGVNYNTIIQLNNDLAATYGTHFIDIRSYLVSQYNASDSQDVIDYTNDVPPSSLRSDNIHLNSTGYIKVAQKISEKISVLQGSTRMVLTPQNVPSLFSSMSSIGSSTISSGYFSNIAIGTTTTSVKLNLSGLMNIYGGAITFKDTNGAGASSMYLSGNNLYLHVSGSGLIGSADNVQDLGTTGYRFRDLNLARNANVLGDLNISGYLNAASTTAGVITSSLAKHGADGNFRMITKNGTSTNGNLTEIARIGSAYSTSWNSGLRFLRGSSTIDGSIAIDTNNTERIRINSAGNLGIGTTTPQYTLSASGTVQFFGLTASAGTPGSICYNTTTFEISRNNASSCTVSSARFKHDIEDLSYTDGKTGLEKLLEIKPRQFIYNGTTNPRIGFIAEEMAQVDPRLVFYEDDGTTIRGVRYEEVTSLLAKSIQDLNYKLEGIRASSTEGDYEDGNNRFNLNNKMIVNVKSISATNGSWSIDENGIIRARVICLEDICLDKNELYQLKEIIRANGGPSDQNSGSGSITTPQENGTSTDPIENSTSTDASIDPIGDVTDSEENQENTSTTTENTPVEPIVVPEVPPSDQAENSEI